MRGGRARTVSKGRSRRRAAQPRAVSGRGGQGARRRRALQGSGKPARRWVQTVTTVSTSPPKGLFTKDTATIARTLASPAVSPRGIASGLRMLLFFINRAGRGLTRRRRAELERAKRLMQAMMARERGSDRRAQVRATP